MGGRIAGTFVGIVLVAFGAAGCGTFPPDRLYEKCPFEADLVKTITVDASAHWQSSGVFVHSGDKVVVTSKGKRGSFTEIIGSEGAYHAIGKSRSPARGDRKKQHALLPRTRRYEQCTVEN